MSFFCHRCSICNIKVKFQLDPKHTNYKIYILKPCLNRVPKLQKPIILIKHFLILCVLVRVVDSML